MALSPWNVLAGGRIRTDEEEQRRIESGEGGRRFLVGDNWKRSESERSVCQALEKVAKEVGAKSITSGTLGSTSVQYQLLTHVSQSRLHG